MYCIKKWWPCPPPPSPPLLSPPPPSPSTPCSSFDRPPEFRKWVHSLFQMADADGSGTVNDDFELRMLLSYLNLEPSEACGQKLNELLSQSLNSPRPGIRFKDFFGWLKDCLPEGHVWRDCPPPPSPPSQPPRIISNPCGKVRNVVIT